MHQGGNKQSAVSSTGPGSGNAANVKSSQNQQQIRQHISQVAYGFMTAQPASATMTQQISARNSATSAATSGSRSNDRVPSEQNYVSNNQPISYAAKQIGKQQHVLLNSAAGSNYYYSNVVQTADQVQQQQLQTQYQSSQRNHHQHAPSNLSNKSSGSKGNSVVVGISAGQQNNQMGAMQAYSSQPPYSVGTGKQTKKTAYLNDHSSQFSPPSNNASSSASGIINQLIMGASKKSVGGNNTGSSGPQPNQSNLNRYETLQSKLKNKRRGQPTGSLIGSNSSQIIGPSIAGSTSKNLQSNGDQRSQFNQTQNIVMNAFGQQSSNGQLSNRKQLKLSVDQHSDSSFNNISIKSADKHNNVVRQIAAGLLSYKNNTQTLNMKDLSQQISPSSHNGGSILQNFNSSQNSVYSSNFSNNSRFNNRPKNPTDTSSLSSKNSDTLSSHVGQQQQVLQQNTTTKAVLADLKKNLLQKQQLLNNNTHGSSSQTTSKQSAIQMIKDQQQMLIKQHQQSDSLSDNNPGGNAAGGSFSSNHSQTAANEAVLQKPLQSKMYNSINTKIQQSNQQMKTSNSIANLSKIGQQIQLTAQQVQSNVPQTPGYKSKFTLMNRAIEKPQIMESTSKNSNGGDSYRRHTEISKKKTSVSKTSGIHCGAPFSPKQSNPNNVSSKIAGLNKSTANNQIYLSNLPQGYRNNGGLIVKCSGAQTNGSIGSTQSKKSGRDKNNKTLEIVQKHSNPASVQVKPQLVKPQQQTKQNDLLQHQIQVTAQLVGIPQTKMNLEQIQSLLIKQQQQQNQQQHNTYKGDTIQEERFEDSEQNTKRESTTNNNQKSNPNQIASSIQDVQIQQQLSNATSYSFLNGPQNSKSLLNLNIDQSQSMKKIEAAPHPEILEQPKQQPAIEEIKQNSALQAMKEKLKAQISLQHHPFSNPNQPSSQIEVAEVAEPVYPIQPRKALQLYFNNLTDHEKVEILEFNEIYFLGLGAQKIQASSQLQHNSGYDDERGDYQVVLQDHLCYRYQILDFLGKGSFGQALKCKDHKNNEEVAVKIIRNKKRFHHQAGVELNILNYLKEHDPDDVNNIIRIKDYSIFRKHLIISFELLSINLYEFIKNNNFNGVSLSLIRRFAIQILQALKYQREHGVIHCDLKPENILLKQPNKSGIKIIDYGSSCFQYQRIYTYIQSRFYRAPEIIMGIPYTTSIDMWSFGCILAELFKGYPLFPGENEMEQLAYIMEIKGVPEDYLLELSSRRKLFFDAENQPIIVPNSKGKKRRPLTKTLKGVLKCTDQNFIDFLDQCLDWDPVNRMTPLEALQHQWILEGLPEKVLMHHQRMFGNRDDKTNIKEATLTPIQGFPPDADNNTIFNLLKTKRAEAIQQRQQQQQQETLPPLPSNDDNNSRSNDWQQPGSTQEQSIPSAANGALVQSQARKTKGNKTIQNLMQELFEEKAQEKSGKHQANAEGVQAQAFYSNQQQQQPDVNSQGINYMQIVEVETKRKYHYQVQNEVNNNEDDLEEGVNFNKTQKIPMSLIKQQEKIPINQQVPFYNPKVTGPKLNNYVNQAAINKKRESNQHAASTTNLNITSSQARAINQSMNNLQQPQLTGNSSMNQGHLQLITNGSQTSSNMIQNTTTGAPPIMINASYQQQHAATAALHSSTDTIQSQHYQYPSSARSGKNNITNVSMGGMSNTAAPIHQYGSYQKMSATSQVNTGKYKLAQAIKVDLESHVNHYPQHVVGGPSEQMVPHKGATAQSHLQESNSVVLKSFRAKQQQD